MREIAMRETLGGHRRTSSRRHQSLLHFGQSGASEAHNLGSQTLTPTDFGSENGSKSDLIFTVPFTLQANRKDCETKRRGPRGLALIWR